MIDTSVATHPLDVVSIQSEYEAACRLAEVVERAGQNPIWSAASGRIYAPSPRALAVAAAEAVREAYQKHCGTLTTSAEIPPKLCGSVDAPFDAAAFLRRLQDAYPEELQRHRSRQQLLRGVASGLRLSWANRPAPKASKAGWTFETYGAAEAFCGRLCMTHSTADHLRGLLPALAEVLAVCEEQAREWIDDVQVAIRAWEGAGRPAGRKDFPSVLGWDLGLFREKVQLRLPHEHAERLQLALSEQEAGPC